MVKSPVKQNKIEINKPNLSDNRSIERRIRQYFYETLSEDIYIPIDILKKIPESFNVQNGIIFTNSILIYDGWRYILAEISKNSINPYGLAVDLGSTSVVFYLYSYAEDKILKTYSYLNPQRRYGDDILSRIIYAKTKLRLDEVHKVTIDFFNETIEKICNENGISSNEIYYFTIAGNTTMMHLFLGISPSEICKEPYSPVFNSIDIFTPNEIGLNINRNARIYIFPNVGSYFGGDLISGIIATGIHKKDEISLLVDVGTNAEVVLGNREWLVATAGAAGPALEGGILSCGTKARPGAIERFYIEESTGEITYKTIDNLPPVGICGSGAIDLLSVLFLRGIVDERGVLSKKEDFTDSIMEINGELSYVVYKGNEKIVYLSQSDIKNLIRSKGAMYTILSVITDSVGITFNDIENIYVAGAFGSYIDPQKAIVIGMLPDIPLEKFKVVGNSSGMGAVEALKDITVPKEAEKIRDKITYIEMNVQGDFMKRLTGALFIPHTDTSLFPTAMNLLKKYCKM